MTPRLATVLAVNLYGSLLMAAGLVGVGLVVLASSPAPVALGATLALLLTPWGVQISRRAPSKARIAEALVRKIRRRGYDAAYFEGMCATACMRLVVRIVLREVGRAAEYRSVVRRHRARGPFTVDVGEGMLREMIEEGAIELADVERAVREALEATSPKHQRIGSA